MNKCDLNRVIKGVSAKQRSIVYLVRCDKTRRRNSIANVQSLSYVASHLTTNEWTLIPERVVDFGHNLVLFLLCFAVYINKRTFESAKNQRNVTILLVRKTSRKVAALANQKWLTPWRNWYLKGLTGFLIQRKLDITETLYKLCSFLCYYS